MRKERSTFYIDARDPERSIFRHRLIGEFREALAGLHKSSKRADGILVLAGPPPEAKELLGTKAGESPENVSRIYFGSKILKQLVAEKLGKEVEGLVPEDLKSDMLPKLILSAEAERLYAMREIARGSGVPEERIYLSDCGRVGEANTRTQFTAITEDDNLNTLKHLIIVTSGYHVPRVARTAAANLPLGMNLEVIGVPFSQFPYDVGKKVRGEIKRICLYSNRGDISRYPRNTRATMPV